MEKIKLKMTEEYNKLETKLAIFILMVKDLLKKENKDWMMGYKKEFKDFRVNLLRLYKIQFKCSHHI